MNQVIKKGVDTMKRGMESLLNIKKDKQEYKAYLGRVRALPDDYQYVHEKMTAYMWGLSGGGNGYDMISLQTDLLELFETSAAEGKSALAVTGPDVAAFCDALLINAKTYTQERREKLNRDILKQLGQ